MSSEEKVFVGTGGLDSTYNMGNIDFSAENSFNSVDISNAITVNLLSAYANSKLGTYVDGVWSNDNVNFNLSDIFNIITVHNIDSLGALTDLNNQYKNGIVSTYTTVKPETLYDEESWLNSFDNTFTNQNLVDLIHNASSASFNLSQINSLFLLWKNASIDINYEAANGFVSGQYIYFPNSINIQYTTQYTDNSAINGLSTITLNKVYNLVFKIL
jgi:hypothetical protein